MKKYKTIILLVVLTACSSKTEYGRDNREKEQANYFENVSKVEVFGDSLRIEFEIHGKTIIQHRIDLKGAEDDGFDNSYTVTSVWSDRNASRLECDKKLKVPFDSLEFWFCTSEVLEYYSNLLSDADESDKTHLLRTRSYLENVKNEKIGHFDSLSMYLPFELAMSLSFQAVDLKANDTISKMLIEDYQTEFSSGKYFHIVNSNNDTTARIHMMGYMR